MVFFFYLILTDHLKPSLRTPYLEHEPVKSNQIRLHIRKQKHARPCRQPWTCRFVVNQYQHHLIAHWNGYVTLEVSKSKRLILQTIKVMCSVKIKRSKYVCQNATKSAWSQAYWNLLHINIINSKVRKPLTLWLTQSRVMLMLMVLIMIVMVTISVIVIINLWRKGSV